MVRAAIRILLDDYDVKEFTRLAARFGSGRYGLVVTSNVDRLIRYREDMAFRAVYDEADYVLLDSRFLSRLLRMFRGIHLRVCPGADLMASLFKSVVARDDTVILIGGSAIQAREMARRFSLGNLQHYNPQRGFIHNADAVENCLRFIEGHSPFRFCFIAVGSPQQELVAQKLKSRARARGLALCIGASINFLTGTERRVPRWMQNIGMEWHQSQVPSREL